MYTDPCASAFVQDDQNLVWLLAAEKNQQQTVVNKQSNLKMTAYRPFTKNTNFQIRAGTDYKVHLGFKIFASGTSANRIDAADSIDTQELLVRWNSASSLASLPISLLALFLIL